MSNVAHGPLVFCCLMSFSRMFCSYGYLTINSEGLPIFRPMLDTHGLWAGRDLYHRLTTEIGIIEVIAINISMKDLVFLERELKIWQWNLQWWSDWYHYTNFTIWICCLCNWFDPKVFHLINVNLVNVKISLNIKTTIWFRNWQ